MSGSNPLDVEDAPTEDPTSSQVEQRDDLKAGAVREIRDVRREMRKRRSEAQERYERDPHYNISDRNSKYLAGIQNFVLELERFYDGEQCREYWESNVGAPIAELERPGLRKEQVMDTCAVTPGKYPRLINPEVLEPETIEVIESLTDIITLEDARVPFSIELRPRSKRVQPTVFRDEMVIPRPTLDLARVWALDFYKKIGLGLDEQDGEPLEI